MIKLFLSIVSVAACCSMMSCKNKHLYDKQIKELDSLKIVIQQSVQNFKLIDSAECLKNYSTIQSYMVIINTNLKDTVSKHLAENLQDFYSLEKGFSDYIQLRPSLLNSANLSINQLITLSNDLKNGSVEEDEAIEFIGKEKAYAELVVVELQSNTEIIRNHLKLYDKVLPVCETLVKQLQEERLSPVNNLKSSH